jgi:hypothetical protein
VKPINFEGTKVNYSNHALTRSKQRCIPLEVVDFLYDYGEIVSNGSGCELVSIQNKICRKLALEKIQNSVSLNDKHLDCYVISSKDGCVITIGHKLKRIKSKFDSYRRKSK